MIYVRKNSKNSCIFLVMFFIKNFCFGQPFIDDKILSIIYAEEPIVITQKDVNRSNILGRAHSLHSLKLDALICRDACKLKITLPDEAIERMLEQIQKQNNISLDQFQVLLAAEGHTLDSYRQELKNMQIINSMLDFKVHSRATITYESIMAYYNAHPLMQEPTYQLITCFVLFDSSISTHEQKQKITTQLRKKNNFNWTESFKIQDSDIAETKNFIKTMNIQSSVIQEEEKGFRIYTLLNKQESMLVPLTERYEDIVKILKEPLEKELLAKYHAELLDNAIIVDF